MVCKQRNQTITTNTPTKMTITTTPEQLKTYKIEAMESSITLQKWVLRMLDEAAVKSKAIRLHKAEEADALYDARRAELRRQAEVNPYTPAPMPEQYAQAVQAQAVQSQPVRPQAPYVQPTQPQPAPSFWDRDIPENETEEEKRQRHLADIAATELEEDRRANERRRLRDAPKPEGMFWDTPPVKPETGFNFNAE